MDLPTPQCDGTYPLRAKLFKPRGMLAGRKNPKIGRPRRIGDTAGKIILGRDFWACPWNLAGLIGSWPWTRKRHYADAPLGIGDTGHHVIGPFETYAPQELRSLLSMLAFDPAGYQARYVDLKYLSAEIALDHFVTDGWREGRVPHFAINISEMQRRLRWLHLPFKAQSSLERMIALCVIKAVDPSVVDWPTLKDLLQPGESYGPALIIGDSHSHFFEPLIFLDGGILPVLLLCSGGSARGLINPNAKSANGPRILNVLESMAREGIKAPIIFKFGQVDIEFVYNFRRVTQQSHTFDIEDAQNYARETVEKYADFVIECRKVCPNQIFISSVFAPTLSDNSVRDGYINAHIGQLHSDDEITTLIEQLKLLEYPSLLARTEHSRFFNCLLKQMCFELGLEFLDEFDGMLDSDGTIDPAYTAAHNGTDHHICLGEAATKGRMRVVANYINLNARRVSSAHS